VSGWTAAAERRIRREQRLVHLIGVGDQPGTPAGELVAGDRLMWNYGTRYTVAAVREVSPQFVEVTERARDGREYTRRLRKDRLVVRVSADRRELRARSAAAKWRADEHTEAPTDEALRAAFARCVSPAKPELYPLIREHIASWPSGR
jgi:hypothetical protein